MQYCTKSIDSRDRLVCCVRFISQIYMSACRWYPLTTAVTRSSRPTQLPLHPHHNADRPHSCINKQDLGAPNHRPCSATALNILSYAAARCALRIQCARRLAGRAGWLRPQRTNHGPSVSQTRMSLGIRGGDSKGWWGRRVEPRQ